MQPEELRLRDTQEWVARCLEDRETADHALTPKRPFLRDCLFRCHQAVEKACKAFLTWQDESFAKTHNVVELGHLCAKADARLADIPRRAAPLNLYAVQFRYPGEPYQPTIEEARNALELARELVAQILACLPSEVQPLGPPQNPSPRDSAG